MNAGGSGGYVGTDEFLEAAEYQTYQTGAGVGSVKRREVVSVDALADLPDRMYANGDIEGYKGLAKLVKNAGFSSWREALAGAAFSENAGQESWSSYLQTRANDPNIREFVKSQGKGGSGGTSTSTSTSVSLSSESQAGAIADSTFRSELGRTASDDEIGGFQKALNAQQKANPSVTNSTTTSRGRSSSSSSTSKGGFDYTRFARQYAQSQDGYAERYAGIKFMDILDSALADPNSIDALVAGQ